MSDTERKLADLSEAYLTVVTLKTSGPHLTGVTLEAGGRGVPVLPLVGHLPLVHPDVLPAGVAELGEQVLEAGAAVGAAVTHDVALAAQLLVALQAAEVVHVPASALRLRALVRKDDLSAEEVT